MNAAVGRENYRSCAVKICGLTNADDALAALEYGADYLGFVLYSGSSRYVDPRVLERVVGDLPSGARTVGVFVNERRENVLSIARECGLHTVQIHGDETSADFDNMNMPVWRAVKIAGVSIEPDPAAWPADRYVIDASIPGKYGGTGVKVDWGIAAKVAETYPVMLAGGLTPDNVAGAVRAVCPLGVDVSGGVESEPGKKDLIKMRLFIENAKNVGKEYEKR